MQWAAALATTPVACSAGPAPVTRTDLVLISEEQGAQPTGDPAVLGAFVDRANHAWRVADPSALAALYRPDATIEDAHETGNAARRELRPELEDLMDGAMKQHITRGLQSGDTAIVEWVYEGVHPAHIFGVRGASVLTFHSDGRVAHEVRYHDHSTLMGQVVAGWRAQLANREPALPPNGPVRVDANTRNADDGVLRRFLEGTEGAGRPVEVSNQFLPTDSLAEEGMAEELARAFSKRSLDVRKCLSGTQWSACVVERGGTFSAPLGMLKPTNRRGVTHWLEVAEIEDGRVSKLTAYGDGREFLRVFLLPDESGFLPPDQLLEKEPSAR